MNLLQRDVNHLISNSQGLNGRGIMGHQDAILAEVRAFMRSRVILTAAELDLFTRLSEKAVSTDELAAERGLDPRGTSRVLDCLVTFGLLHKADDRYRTTEKGDLFSASSPDSILPMALHLNRLWSSWSNLTEIVREGDKFQRKPIAAMDEESQRAFIGAMHAIGRQLSQEIAARVDLNPYHKLLDIGGASGTYTISFLLENPSLSAVIFDLERVIPMARERLTAEGLIDRAELVAGNFYKDELPKGCDLALLSAIIHQNSLEENQELYEKIFHALNPGGRVIIRDHIMDESRTNPPPGTLFAINMLVNTRGGDTYTFEEIKRGLEQAGFVNVQLINQGERMDGLVQADKPVNRE
jgi:hypothetical protein